MCIFKAIDDTAKKLKVAVKWDMRDRYLNAAICLSEKYESHIIESCHLKKIKADFFKDNMLNFVKKKNMILIIEMWALYIIALIQLFMKYGEEWHKWIQ